MAWGLTTKVHLATDGTGQPLRMLLIAGNVNETTIYAATLEDILVLASENSPHGGTLPGVTEFAI